MAELARPEGLFDRERDWADLVEFVESQRAGLRIGVVYGRRRQGKSFLLRHLCEQVRGAYFQATTQDSAGSLDRFAKTIERTLGLPQGVLSFRDWGHAILTSLQMLRDAGRGLLVLDELPYLLTHTPELPSLLQDAYEEYGPASGGPPLRLIVCGSAISSMVELLSGTNPLYGRTSLTKRIDPFHFRDARTFWRIDDLDTALRVHAVLGGTPGYAELMNLDPPQRTEDFVPWLLAGVMDSTQRLYDEVGYVLREDPRIRDREVYYRILDTITSGHETQARVSGELGRDIRALAHPLSVLEAGGFVQRLTDMLDPRQPDLLRVVDPLLRFHQKITIPYSIDGHWDGPQIWNEQVEQTFTAQVLGPHFESMAREWTRTFAIERLPGTRIGRYVGSGTLPCKEHRGHEVDVVAIAQGGRPQRGSKIALLGEAKATRKHRTLGDLNRLEHLRELLAVRGHDVSGTVLTIFATGGFEPGLIAESARDDVLLLTLPDMYGLTEG